MAEHSLGKGGLARLTGSCEGHNGKPAKQGPDGLFGIASDHDMMLRLFMQIVKVIYNMHKGALETKVEENS